MHLTCFYAGRSCRAGRITLWKNVDGIYTADPRRVPDAFPIKSMLYEEVWKINARQQTCFKQNHYIDNKQGSNKS